VVLFSHFLPFSFNLFEHFEQRYAAICKYNLYARLLDLAYALSIILNSCVILFFLGFCADKGGHAEWVKYNRWPYMTLFMACVVTAVQQSHPKMRGAVGNFESPRSPPDGCLQLAILGGDADIAGTGGEAGRRARALQSAGYRRLIG
jgi:hypothetical protein